MKQVHTRAKKANRRSSFQKRWNYRSSNERRFKRESMQPKLKKCHGLQVRRIQTIKKEAYKGVRYQIIINIEHASGAFDRKR